MNLDSIRHQLDQERRSLAIDERVVEISPQFTRKCSADGSHHAISFSALTAENADAVIAEQVAHYRSLGVEVEWKVYLHDHPPDLRHRLANHGFTIGPLETVLVLDLQNPPPWIDHPANKVIRVQTPDHVERFRTAATKIFQKDYHFTANQLLAAIRTNSTNHLAYIAPDGEIAASIGRLYTHPQSAFGGLYGGGTLKTHRHRGLYRAIVAARALDAIQLGARYLIVDALPTSKPILQKLGFHRLTETWPCVLPPLPSDPG
jgi:hypothetical protein